MQVQSSKVSSGWLSANASFWLAVMLGVLLVICVANLWYQRDDPVARLTVGLAVLLFATGFLFVRESRNRVAASRLALTHRSMNTAASSKRRST